MKSIVMAVPVALMIFIGVSHSAFADTPPEGKYPSVKVSDNVPARPGTVAWSPDGRKIAFISGSPHVYEPGTGQKSSIGIASPVWVTWHGPDKLFVLSREGGKGRLYSVDLPALTTNKVPLDIDADAVFPSSDRGRILLLSTKFKVTSIGTDINTHLALHDLRDGTERTIYSYSKIYPNRKPDIERMTAWMHAGLNPLDGSFLIMEHVKPPVIIPYSKVFSVDTLTTRTRRLFPDDRKKSYVSTSWSPDGMRTALTDREGHLEVTDRNGDVSPVDRTTYGLYPSWNPQGSQIFAGGLLVNSDGTGKETLLPDSFESIGVWSPDGRQLAVAAKNELLIFSKFRPFFLPPDRPFDQDLSRKLLTLRELFHEGLLTEDEYSNRYRNVIQGNRKPL